MLGPGYKRCSYHWSNASIWWCAWGGLDGPTIKQEGGRNIFTVFLWKNLQFPKALEKLAFIVFKLMAWLMVFVLGMCFADVDIQGGVWWIWTIDCPQEVLLDFFGFLFAFAYTMVACWQLKGNLAWLLFWILFVIVLWPLLPYYKDLNAWYMRFTCRIGLKIWLCFYFPNLLEV